MSFAEESAKLGRIPVVVVELTLDYGACVYGTGTCTAEVGVTGTQKCFNTYGTCQDKENYIPGSKTYRFCEPNAALPVGIQALPLVKKNGVTVSPQVITPGKGLGVRGQVSVRFTDMPHHDHGFDPYVTERDYIPMERGSFWGKFRARNEFYEGRRLDLKVGYLTQSAWDEFLRTGNVPAGLLDWDNFEVRRYIIESWKGPDRSGETIIVAKDILKLADDNRALFPPPSNGRLASAIDEDDTSFTLVPADIGDEEYPASFRCVIGGEGMDCTRSGDAVTITARDVYGTGARSHNEDDSVQVVGRIINAEVHEVPKLLLESAPGFDPAWINETEWKTERDLFLPGVWSTDVCEPTGINTLLAEHAEQGLYNIYWDETDQQVRFRAVRPPSAGLPVLREGVDFQDGTPAAADDPGQRISRFYILYDRIDPTAKLDEPNNYRQRFVRGDLESEGDNEYGTKRIRTIYSRWFRSTSQARVEALSDTLLKRYSKPPRLLQYDADISQLNLVKVGDNFMASTRQLQDATGANAAVPMQVVEQGYLSGKVGSQILVKAQEYVWNARANDTSSLQVIIGRNYPNEDYGNLDFYEAFFAEYGDPLPGQTIEFLILPGVYISASFLKRQSGGAIFPATKPGGGAAWPDGCTVRLINKGVIAGRGGAGGRGAYWNGSSAVAAQNGAAGNTGLIVVPTGTTATFEIDNTDGVIAGGGGGGGGGGAIKGTFPFSSHGGGGGGGGRAIGDGGAGGAPTGSGTNVTGPAGGTATHEAAGSGGFINPTGRRGGSGGDGGGYATAGQAGTAAGGGGDLIAPGNGGIAGAAVAGDANIIWIAEGTIVGARI